VFRRRYLDPLGNNRSLSIIVRDIINIAPELTPARGGQAP
jgi:hypothetical protein